MTLLSVNINKLATLRNSRGGNLPDVLQTTLDIERFGAQGITVHPRPDERHVKKSDVFQLSQHIHVEFNIEGYPSADFLNLIKEIRPAQCTLVPDPPHVLTSNAGWNVQKEKAFLKEVIKELHSFGVRSSLFVDPYDYNDEWITHIKATGTQRVELYTEAYAKAFPTALKEKVTAVYAQAGHRLHQEGIDINAGHDLNLNNLNYFVTHLPFVKEVSIGHALICDALYFGLEKTIQKYLAALQA